METYKSSNYADKSIVVLTGNEKIFGVSDGVTIKDFWQWAYSDIIRNTKRGVFAEFLVKCALDMNGFQQPFPIRLDFEPWDLRGPAKASNNELCKLEIKSASNIQSWDTQPKEPSTIRFSIAPAKMPDETGDYPRNASRQRNADIYIFCIYSPKRDLSITSTENWDFFVVTVKEIEEEKELHDAKTISIERLKKLKGAINCSFDGLYDAIVSQCRVI